MSMAIGTRVIAILSAKGTVVNLLGYGVFEGNHTPPGTPTFEQMWADPEVKKPDGMTEERARQLYETNPFFQNPRIKLDNGDTVWGKECWWGATGGTDTLPEKYREYTIRKCRIVRDDAGVAIDVIYED